MEYLIGAILGGAIALIGAFIGKSLPENLPLPAFNATAARTRQRDLFSGTTCCAIAERQHDDI